MKRFFILSDLSGDYDFEEFSSEEEVLSAIQETVDFACTWPDGAEWFDRLVWGKVLGTVEEDGQLIPVLCEPDPETERLRAELAAFRARMAAVLAELQTLHAQHRLVPASYNRERAEAFGNAVDLLEEALTVGGEE